jgi:hypothetical protein
MKGKNAVSPNVLKTIIAKAWSDAAFKAQLLANANDALAPLGINAPEGVTIKFIEDTPTTWHFVIPTPFAGVEFTDELAKVVGGASSGGMIGRPKEGS